MFRVATLLAVAAALTGGCAARAAAHRQPSAPAATEAPSPTEALETFIGKGRALAAKATPATPAARTLEASDPALAAALLSASAFDTADSHRLAAQEYMRLGILDAAHEQLTAAVKRDPRDASSWDLLARIWRDWGLPHLGLPDAQRARYFAPTSAVVHNTAGTLLQALGRRQAAREEFERAIALDPNAAYAHSNLCYSLLIQRHDAEAVRECERAVALAPDFGPARNNLALAYAAVGQLDRAAQTFKGDSDPARAQFNLGLVRFARHDYTGAVDAFVAAQQLRPDFARARTLARQAHDYQQRGDD